MGHEHSLASSLVNAIRVRDDFSSPVDSIEITAAGGGHGISELRSGITYEHWVCPARRETESLRCANGTPAHQAGVLLRRASAFCTDGNK